jgi:hypothetical protein
MRVIVSPFVFRNSQTQGDHFPRYPNLNKIHNVLHVSCLKKALGQQVTTSAELPPLNEEQLVLVPKEVLEVREKKLRNRVIREYLIRWRDLPAEDATYDGD